MVEVAESILWIILGIFVIIWEFILRHKDFFIFAVCAGLVFWSIESTIKHVIKDATDDIRNKLDEIERKLSGRYYE